MPESDTSLYEQYYIDIMREELDRRQREMLRCMEQQLIYGTGWLKLESTPINEYTQLYLEFHAKT